MNLRFDNVMLNMIYCSIFLFPVKIKRFLRILIEMFIHCTGNKKNTKTSFNCNFVELTFQLTIKYWFIMNSKLINFHRDFSNILRLNYAQEIFA